MANTNVGTKLKAKSIELKKWFMDLDAKLEQWKFSVEDTKEGTAGRTACDGSH